MFNITTISTNHLWCVRYEWKSKGKTLHGTTVVDAVSHKAVRGFFRRHHSNVRVTEIIP